MESEELAEQPAYDLSLAGLHIDDSGRKVSARPQWNSLVMLNPDLDAVQ